MNHAITQLIVRLVENAARKPRKATENLVHLSPVLLWVGLICGGIFLIPGLLVPLHTGDWTAAILFLCFSALGFSMVVGYINCRITYSESEFTVKYFLGYRRTFTYDQIESIRGKAQDVKLMVNGHAVRIDELSVGKAEFLSMARKQYRITHGGKAIPQIQKDKWDPFNGHVENAGEFVFVYLLIALFMPAALIVCFFTVQPTPMEELAMVTGTATSAAVDGSDLVLRVEGIEMEIWGYQRALDDPEGFLRDLEGGERFTLGYRTVTDDGKFVGFCVEYIRDAQGSIRFTPEDARNERFVTAALAFGVVELIWLAFCGISIYVGRNPHKFSKQVIRWFFKEGYVH